MPARKRPEPERSLPVALRSARPRRCGRHRRSSDRLGRAGDGARAAARVLAANQQRGKDPEGCVQTSRGHARPGSQIAAARAQKAVRSRLSGPPRRRFRSSCRPRRRRASSGRGAPRARPLASPAQARARSRRPRLLRADRRAERHPRRQAGPRSCRGAAAGSPGSAISGGVGIAGTAGRQPNRQARQTNQTPKRIRHGLSS